MVSNEGSNHSSWSDTSSRESLSIYLIAAAPPDAVFMAAAEKFASWAAVEEVTEENPIKFIRGLSTPEDFNELSSTNQRTVLDLAFSTYRFLEQLQEVLIDSGFSDGAPIPAELNSLAVVMLWELTQRRFIVRGTRSKGLLGQRIDEVQEVEGHLDKFAVKLAASFSRLRIRESALTLAASMSPEIKESEQSRSMARVFTWPNKFHVANVIDQLEVMNIEFTIEQNLRHGLLSFDHELLDRIESSELMKEKSLILSDATSIIPATIVNNLTNNGFSLHNDEETFSILHAGGTFHSVPILCHMVYKAGLVLQQEHDHQKFLFGSTDTSHPDIEMPKLYICAQKTKHETLKNRLLELGINESVFSIIPPLSTLEPSNKLVASIKICVVEPECSLTLTSDPIQYLLIEGKGSDDKDCRLQLIAQGVSKPQEGMKTILQAALALPRSNATLYITHSKLPAENEEVVQSVLSSVPPEKNYKLTNIPLELPVELAKETTGKYLRIPKSNNGSGCFCAVISRNEPDPKTTLKKAALKGLYVPYTAKLKTRK